jgi:hypothetical protein
MFPFRPTQKLLQHCHPRKPRNSTGSTNSVNMQANRSSLYRAASSGSTCKTPGCSTPIYVHPNGSDYCSKRHRECVLTSLFCLMSQYRIMRSWGARGCIRCRGAPKIGKDAFCQFCHDWAAQRAPTLVPIPEDHDTYGSSQSIEKNSCRI